MGFVSKIFGGDSGKDAGKAAIQGANISAEAQREALAYLKEREAIPQALREESLSGLAGIYGLKGDDVAQGLMGDLKGGALYQEIYGNKGRSLEAGEEAIMRNQAMTGGLRSGNTQDALSRYAGDLESQYRNQALNASLGGLQSMANMPSNANQIAGTTAGIGNTIAQGHIAAAQAGQAGQQQGMGNLMGIANLGLQAYGAFSDPRLKDNAKVVGKSGPLNIYEWDWNKAAEKLGLTGRGRGVMADEVEALFPDAVTIRDGYKYVEFA